MAIIKATDLATLLPEDIDSSYNVVVFDPSGNTNQVAFQAATHQANANNGCICVKEASLTIPSADVLQLNSTPLTIVNGISGKVIVPISAILKSTYNSATYATNLGIFLRHTGSSSPITENSNKLGFTSNIINQFTLRNDTDEDQLISGADLEVFVDSGNPTAGDSDITIYVTYRVITL